jgi:23S rRNA-/tRNA-specific pseudouridylate synthase
MNLFYKLFTPTRPWILNGLSLKHSVLFSSEPISAGNYIKVIIEDKDMFSNHRLDKFIQNKYSLKWEFVQKIFRQKKIKVLSKDKEVSIYSPSYMIKLGDIITIHKSFYEKLVESQQPDQEIMNSEAIDENKAELFEYMKIFEDENFIAINKMPEISSQGGSDVKFNLLSLLQNYLKGPIAYGPTLNPAIVHRLDQCTTGVMLVSKKRHFAQDFGLALRSREGITKEYIAIGEGIPSRLFTRDLDKRIKSIKFSGKITAPVKFDDRLMKSEANLFNQEDSKECITDFDIVGFIKHSEDLKIENIDYILNPEILQSKRQDFDSFFNSASYQKINYATIYKFKIEGGRKHQIRVHASDILGTPLLLDRKYGYKNNFNNLIDRIIETPINNNTRRDWYMASDSIHSVSKKIEPGSEVEKFMTKVLLKKSFIFLHSNRLIFKHQDQIFAITAGLPNYFLDFLCFTFQEDYNVVLKYISNI